MNVVDSSGWLEYFSDGPNAGRFAKPLMDTQSLVVPVIVIYEVFKVLLRERGENVALQALVAMRKSQVEDITPVLAVEAAKLGLELSLPMADSIILATARSHGEALWTQDSDFASIPGVMFFQKKT